MVEKNEMKNKKLERSILDNADWPGHKLERNRAKRYRQGRMTVRTYLGKKQKTKDES
jgi:hypothetical protein